MQLYLTIISVFGLSALCASKLVDYRLTLTAETPKPCTTSGLLCETCSTLVACVLNSDQTFRKDNVKTCSAGEKCINGACTSAGDPYCDGVADLAFPCPDVGVFPDPFYCDKYVLCVMAGNKLTGYLNKCEEGLGYNIGTGICDVKLGSEGCKVGDYPVPLCEKPGDTGALKDKPQQYYMCEEYSAEKKMLYPFIRICPQAQIYNNFECAMK